MRPTDGEGRVPVNGIRHWYRIVGAERGTTPLVVVHGGPGGNVYNFERTVGPRLEDFATLIYYEQRGCGRSDPPSDPDDYAMPSLVGDLDGLRAALGLDRIALLGFSFGCELALEYALRHPEGVERLVLQCPSVAASGRIGCVQLYGFESVARGGVTERLRELLAAPIPIEEKHERAWGMADTETVDRLLFFDPEHAALNRRMWGESGLVNTGDMARTLAKRSGDGPPLYRRIADVEVPTLVLVGLHDRNVGVDVARDVARSIPQARLVILERSAHFPDIEEPGEYAAAVRAFLLGARAATGLW